MIRSIKSMKIKINKASVPCLTLLMPNKDDILATYLHRLMAILVNFIIPFNAYWQKSVP